MSAVAITEPLPPVTDTATYFKELARRQREHDQGEAWRMRPFPVPVVTSRDGVAKPLPPSAAKLADRAEVAGWTVLRQYARGCTPHATTGKPGPARDSFALVMAHPDGRRACAVYMGQSSGFKWESMWVLSSSATRRCPTQGALIFTLVTGAPLPAGTDFAEPLMSARRGPEMLRLVDGAVWADWLGVQHGPPVA